MPSTTAVGNQQSIIGIRLTISLMLIKSRSKFQTAERLTHLIPPITSFQYLIREPFCKRSHRVLHSLDLEEKKNKIMEEWERARLDC
jgi:hypothetical protein